MLKTRFYLVPGITIVYKKTMTMFENYVVLLTLIGLLLLKLLVNNKVNIIFQLSIINIIVK